jgi:membrane-associated HD superfamily phosphohydrolase
VSKVSTTQTPDKERGGWLTAWLILILLHGIIASVLIFYLRQQQSESSPAWVLSLLFLLSIADIVAAIAMWYWKKWGLMLYLLSTVAGIAIGLILTRSQLIVFHDIIPLAILGYLVRDKLDWFD